MYAENKTLAYELYQRAKAFSQRPSDLAVLDECVDHVGRFYFDRGIWRFGDHVHARLDEISANTKNPAIAQSQREREWERLMGADMESSTAGFADPSPETMSAHGRSLGDIDDDDDVMVLD